jgi:hypothetical protein
MKPRKELTIALGIIAFCVLNLVHLIPSQVAAEGSKTTYPHLLNIMLFVFSVFYAAEALWQMRRMPQETRRSSGSRQGFIATYGRTMLLIIVMAIWLFSMEVAGFILSTFLFLLAAAFIFGARSIWKPVVLSVTMPLIFHGIFRGLNSMLPEGPIEILLNTLLG